MLNQIIVITGATSGIGQATAFAFAKRKCRLVLAARGQETLDKVANECRAYGSEVITMAIDVAHENEVHALSDYAIKTFGAIDVWVNNAGIISYSEFLLVEPRDFQRVIEVNLYGTMYGSQAALEQFRIQRYGTLINVSSAYGMFPAPYASAYVASKFAVRGFTASIREELLAGNFKDIHVCTVSPGTINTPIYDISANSTKRKVRALQPAYPANAVARVIMRMTHKPKTEVIVGYAAYVPARLYSLVPTFLERAMSRYVRDSGFADQPTVVTKGNMYESRARGKISGDWSVHYQRIGKLIGLATMIGIAGITITRRNRKENII